MLYSRSHTNTPREHYNDRSTGQWSLKKNLFTTSVIGLRRRFAAARLLRLWVQIPPGHGCLSVVSVVCCKVEVSAPG